MKAIFSLILFILLYTSSISVSGQVITLHIAVQQGDLNKVAELVEGGTDVNLTDRYGLTALTIAAFNEQFEILQYLVEHGANVNAMDNKENYPLMLAAMKGNLSIVQYLIQQGAMADEQGKNGQTALMWSCIGTRGINTEVIKLLTTYSSDINIKDNFGKTALDYAQDEKARQILLSAGALKGSEIK